MTATGFAPTAEQTKALELFATGTSLAIEAGAGAGKTSTLTLLGRSTGKRVQYVAFNRAIVDESRAKMPQNVNCSTAHSLAFREVGKRYQHRLRGGRMKPSDQAKRLGIDPIGVTTQDGEYKRLSAARLAGIVNRTLNNFCQSADLEPTEAHVPYVKGIDIPPGRMENNRLLRRHVMPYVRAAWKDAQDVNGSLPFTHDRYLKLWHLSNPRIGADVILFDECQDANPVMLAIVEAQQHAQRVYVGDSQQAIYGFTGAVNALERIAATGAPRTFLSQSFRFGPAVAEIANVCLAALGAELRITGTDSRPSQVRPVTNPDAILCRTNATAMAAVFAAIDDGSRPHLVGGGTEIVAFAKAARDLRDSGYTSHPELACFDSWDEVVAYVAQDEQGDDLRLLVGLVEKFGVEQILAALDGMVDEANADLIVSTAHKAKGREWDAVRLADDFPEEPEAEELRLLYVAVTRARLDLDVTNVKWLTDRIGVGGVASALQASTPVAPDAEDAPAPAAPETAAQGVGTNDGDAPDARSALAAILGLCEGRDGTNNDAILRKIHALANGALS